MKTGFVKEKINGVSWCIASELLPQDDVSAKQRILGKLKDIKDSLSLPDFGVSASMISQESRQRGQFNAKKAFVPIKVGRRKIFGIMNLLDKGGEHDVYVKIYNCSSLLLKLKHVFIPSKANREFTLSFKINECGIPGVLSIANGHERSMGILKRSYLIIKKINNVVNLKEFFYDPDLRAKEKHVVIERFGEVARLSHDHGILQTDFALNNFLVQKISDENYRIYMIDYERTKIKKNMTDKMKFWTLAKLNRVGSDFSTTDKLRFLRSYFNYKKDSSNQSRPLNIGAIPGLKKAMRSIDEETGRRLKKNAWKEWKDCVKNGRKFKLYNGKNMRGYHVNRHNANVLVDMINGFSEFEVVKEIVFCDSVKITSVVATLPDKVNDERIVIYKIDGNDLNFCHTFWQNSNALVKGRLNVFRPIGVFVKDRVSRITANGRSDLCSDKEGYLIMPHSGLLQDLNDFLQGVNINPERRAFLSKLTQFICRLHNFGKFVTNINPGDIVVNLNKDRYNFYFAHTYNFKFNTSLSHKERIADIERVAYYLGDNLKDGEFSFFKKMYAKNEAWYHSN
ncbi:MAG: lipopolysaccharide kinase InaA family protein [Candidatus Anammoxibacter sp.]